MDDINNRFSIFYEHLKSEGVVKNASDFAKFLGVSSSMITEFTKGRSSIGTTTLQNAVINLSLNSDWLLTGKGDMLKVSQLQNTEKINNISQKISQKISHSVSKGIITIPITDISVAAGDGAINNDYIDVVDNIQLPETLVKSGVHLCVKIKGDSMAPTLQDGGYMVIRNIDRSQWDKQPDERIYVVSTTDGMAYLKRLKLRIKKGFIVCMSDSPDKSSYPNFNLELNEINTLWYAEWYFSAKMPNIHDQYYNRLQRIEDDLDEMKAQFKRINK